MTLPPRSACWRAGLAGVLGAASGFALFVLWWEERETHESPVIFVLALLVAAGVSFAFESLREGVEGHEEKRARLPDTLVTITLLVIFELFVLGLHTTIALTAHLPELKQVGDLVLGEALVGQSHSYLHLVIMILLWVSAAVVLTLGLCVAVFDPGCTLPPSCSWREVRGWGAPTVRAAGIGGLTGAVGGPLAVLGYAFGVRAVAEVRMILFDTGRFVTHLRGLADHAPLPWNIPVGALRLLFEWLSSLLGERWGPIVALVVSIGLAVWSLRTSVKWPAVVIGVVFAIPLLGGAGYLFKLGAAVAMVWALPGIVLGAMIPWLSTPSRYPALWGFVAFIAALILVGLAWAARQAPLAAGVLVSFGLAFGAVAVALFWRGGAIERYWPILAMSVAVNVFGGTHLMQGIDFFNIQKEAYFFSRSPLLTVQPRLQLPDPGLRLAELSRQLRLFALSLDSATGTLKASSPTPRSTILSGPTSPGVVQAESEIAVRMHEMDSVEKVVTSRYESLRASLGTAERHFRLSDSLSLQEQATQLDTLRAGAPRLGALTDSLTYDLDQLLGGELAKPAVEESPSWPALWFLRSPEATRLRADQADLTRRREVFQGRLRALGAATRAARASVMLYQSRLDRAREEVDRRIVSARQLELAMTASLGFWATIGILASWAIRRGSGHGAPGGTHAAHGEEVAGTA